MALHPTRTLVAPASRRKEGLDYFCIHAILQRFCSSLDIMVAKRLSWAFVIFSRALKNRAFSVSFSCAYMVSHNRKNEEKHEKLQQNGMDA